MYEDCIRRSTESALQPTVACLTTNLMHSFMLAQCAITLLNMQGEEKVSQRRLHGILHFVEPSALAHMCKNECTNECVHTKSSSKECVHLCANGLYSGHAAALRPACFVHVCIQKPCAKFTLCFHTVYLHDLFCDKAGMRCTRK